MRFVWRGSRFGLFGRVSDTLNLQSMQSLTIIMSLRYQPHNPKPFPPNPATRNPNHKSSLILLRQLKSKWDAVSYTNRVPILDTRFP